MHDVHPKIIFLQIGPNLESLLAFLISKVHLTFENISEIKILIIPDGPSVFDNRFTQKITHIIAYTTWILSYTDRNFVLNERNIIKALTDKLIWYEVFTSMKKVYKVKYLEKYDSYYSDI